MALRAFEKRTLRHALGTKPSKLLQADDGAGERGEVQVDVGPSLVADRQAPEPGLCQEDQEPFRYTLPIVICRRKLCSSNA